MCMWIEEFAKTLWDERGVGDAKEVYMYIYMYVDRRVR